MSLAETGLFVLSFFGLLVLVYVGDTLNIRGDIFLTLIFGYSAWILSYFLVLKTVKPFNLAFKLALPATLWGAFCGYLVHYIHENNLILPEWFADTGTVFFTSPGFLLFLLPVMVLSVIARRLSHLKQNK